MKILVTTLYTISLLYLNVFSMGGESEFIENGLVNRSDLVFFGGFEKPTCTSEWQKAWATSYIQGCNRLSLVQNSTSFQNTKSLKFTLEKGLFGNGCKIQFPMNFKNMPGSPQKTYDSLYFRYYVQFLPGFDFKKGGKLPGLMSVDGNSISGGAQPNGSNGWTMRYMWNSGGSPVIYAYLPEGYKYAGGAWGKTMSLAVDGKNVAFTRGKWHCMEQYVKINDIGKENGKLYVWFDGKQCLKLDDVTYRTVDNEKGKIGGVFFSVFHGGNNSTYAPSVNSEIMFDNMVAAIRPVGVYSINEIPATDVIASQSKISGTSNPMIKKIKTGNDYLYKIWAGKSLEGVSLVISDMAGRKMRTQWVINKENETCYATFSVNGLVKGVYNVAIRDEKKTIINSQKIIVK